MDLVQLRASLALWRRRHAYRQRQLDIAHQRNDAAAIAKWEALRREAGDRIHLRLRQIAAKTVSRREQAVTHARGWVGTTESPWGSNYGGIITTWQRRLGFARAPWCGIFVANMLLAVGVRNVSSRLASVSLIEADARAARGCFRGWASSPTAALRGDIVCIGRLGQHVGLVVSVNARAATVSTIEGNVANGVRAMVRPFSMVRGVAQVNYPS